jgi:hypothetical protein
MSDEGMMSTMVMVPSGSGMMSVTVMMPMGMASRSRPEIRRLPNGGLEIDYGGPSIIIEDVAEEN